jgi:hypothetical protein
MWMGRTGLEAAYDMDGAFNDLAFTLSPGADKNEDVLKLIDDLLRPYGGQGAYWRTDQPSHFIHHRGISTAKGHGNRTSLGFFGGGGLLA